MFGLILVCAIFSFWFVIVVGTIVVGCATFIWIRFVRFPPLIEALQQAAGAGAPRPRLRAASKYETPSATVRARKHRAAAAADADAAGQAPRAAWISAGSGRATDAPRARRARRASPARSSGATPAPTSPSSRSRARASIAPHTNPNTSLFIVVSGGGWVQVGEERVRINHGEAVVWPAGVPHGAWTDGSEMRAIVVELPEVDTELVIDGAAARGWTSAPRLRRPRRRWAPSPIDRPIRPDAMSPKASPGSCRLRVSARPGTRSCACSASAPGRGRGHLVRRDDREAVRSAGDVAPGSPMSTRVPWSAARRSHAAPRVARFHS